jgi:hypothetical protein
MHLSAWQYIEQEAAKLPGGTIVEIGSRIICGDIRGIFQAPKWRFVGVDIVAGQGVDIVSSAKDYAAANPHSADFVVCANVLEHDPTWRETVNALFAIAKSPDGVVLVSVPGPGWPVHETETCGDYYGNLSVADFAELGIKATQAGPETVFCGKLHELIIREPQTQQEAPRKRGRKPKWTK